MKASSSIVKLEITGEDKQLVKRLADGIAGVVIAKEQKVNYNTFAFNLKVLKNKVGANNTPHLVSYFLRNKLID